MSHATMSEVGSDMRQRVERQLLRPIADAQISHPWRFLLLALITVAFALALASKLTLKSALSELLPDNKQSVIVARQVRKKLSSVSTLSVLIEGSDNDGLKRFVDELVVKLDAIGPPLIDTVEGGVQASRKFIHDYRFLYAPLDTVQKVHDEIMDRYEYEVGKRAGFLLDEDDPPPPLTEASIASRLERRSKASGLVSKANARYPDGYYLDEKNHAAVVLIRTPLRSGDIAGSKALVRTVHQTAKALHPERFDPAIRIRLGGNLLTSAEVRAQIEEDLAHVGAWGVLLILSVVFLYYLRLRTVIAMTLTIAIGASWTFGLAYLLVGHLNSSTGFLFSIIVGNGINFGIIYMARYLEARREHPGGESVRMAQAGTWVATLTAATAASCAYGSLAVTNFRGFKEFGLIGGSGMLLCWTATYLFLPPILLLFERLKPIQPPRGWLARLRGLYGRPFAALASGYPRAVLFAGALITLTTGYLAVGYLRSDPMEYNMRRIGNAAVGTASEATKVGRLVHRIVGRQGVNGIAIATEEVAQVEPLAAALMRRRAAAPPNAKPFGEVVTIFSLLPKNQKEKLKLVREARSTLEAAHKKTFLPDDDWNKIAKLLPSERMHELGITDLNPQMARPFTEKDGTRGRLVYVTPTRHRSVWDGKYLVQWADSMRATKLPDGKTIYGSGRSVIFADMIIAVGEDAPKAIGVSLLLTLLVVLLAFRGRRAGLQVILSVLVGLTWTLGFLAIYESQWPWNEGGGLILRPLKLNFLNFVALPITIGVGADYAVNIMQRHASAGGEPDAIKQAAVETGGAVVLCSLTTTLGYAALTLSVNHAVQGFGVAAVAGEIACVVSGVLILPAYLWWRHGTASATTSS